MLKMLVIHIAKVGLHLMHKNECSKHKKQISNILENLFMTLG